jgi:AcrR family transcriptional regulator
VYHYFRAKREILDTIVITTLDGLMETVAAAAAEAESPRDRLVAFVTGHAAYFEANYSAFTTMLVGFGGLGLHATPAAVVERRDRYEGLLRRILQEGVDSGDFRAVHIPTASRAALSMLNWMARWFDPSGPERAAEIAARYAELLLDGLGQPAPTRAHAASREVRRAARRAEARLEA